MEIKAAGCLVVKYDDNGEPLFLAINRKDAKDEDGWDIPCGKVEIGEWTFDAALRELNEETGVTGISWWPHTFIAYNPVDSNFVEIFEVLQCEGIPSTQKEGEVAYVPMENILKGNYKQYNRAMLAYFGFAVPKE